MWKICLFIYLYFIEVLKNEAVKTNVNIVVFDRVKGYLNWFQDWFREAAINHCSTR